MAMEMLKSCVFPPAPSNLLTVITVMGSLSITVLGIAEFAGKHLQYSKFWNSSASFSSNLPSFKLSGRTGMLLLYTPAFLAGVFSFIYYPNDNLRLVLVKSALTLHFFKRDLEVLFVHKYSSKMVLDSAILISMSYFLHTVSIIYGQVLSQGLFPELDIDLKYVGVVLFLIGIIGNFYHHKILSDLRGSEKGDSSKEYKIPNGGLFGLVTCPHYLFEIIDLLGVSLIAQTLYPFCFTLASSVYLIGRSYTTKKWYISKFEDFPKHIKAFLPFVF